MQQKKTAQNLSLRQRARRGINFTGKAFESLSPAFRKLIRNMDRLDKSVRKEAEDMNYLLGMAKSFSKRRDYLSAATYLAKFHEKARNIDYELREFDTDITKDQRAYLLKSLQKKDKEVLFSYDPKKDLAEERAKANEKRKAKAPAAIEKMKNTRFPIGMNADDGLVSTAASLKDWWRIPSGFSDLKHNLTDNKSKGMKALEKNFSTPFFSQLREQTREMLDTSTAFYKRLIDSFTNLGSAWSTRNVGQYVQEIKELNAAYKPYHDTYVTYHDNNIVPLQKEQAKNDEESKSAVTDKNPRPASALDAEKDPFKAEKDPFPTEAPQNVFVDQNSILEEKSPTTQRSAGPATSVDIPVSWDLNPSTTRETRPPSFTSVRPVSNKPAAAPPSSAKPSSMSIDDLFETPASAIDAEWSRIHREEMAKAPQPTPFAEAPSTRLNNRGQTFDLTPSRKAPPTTIRYEDDVPPTLRSPMLNTDEAAPSTLRPTQVIPGSPTQIFPASTVRAPMVSVPKARPVNPLTMRSVPTQRQPYFTNAHEDFLKKIEVLGTEKEIVEEILRYSAELEKSQKVEESMKILAIAEGIMTKEAGVLDKPKGRGKKKEPAELIPSPPSMPPPDDDPDTEPGGERAPNTLDMIRPADPFKPVEHGIPQGEFKATERMRWSQIPFLAKIQPDHIRVSKSTSESLMKSLIKHFYHNYIPYKEVENFQDKLIVAIKNSLRRGELVSNLACGDKHNGRDCSLRIFTYMNLAEIHPFFEGMRVSYVAELRLSVFGGDLTLNRILSPQLIGDPRANANVPEDIG